MPARDGGASEQPGSPRECCRSCWLGMSCLKDVFLKPQVTKTQTLVPVQGQKPAGASTWQGDGQEMLAGACCLLAQERGLREGQVGLAQHW